LEDSIYICPVIRCLILWYLRKEAASALLHFTKLHNEDEVFIFGP
jgi:hypothetical protein